MKLCDLVELNNWLSVELTLLRLYPDQEEMIEEYRGVFERLKNIEPRESRLEIVVRELIDDSEVENQSNTCFDVVGREIVPDPSAVTSEFAIEFSQWADWLGMSLASETIAEYSELEILAHCLYEMTFISFDEDDIQDQFKAISDTADELRNLSEEDRSKKTISLDELMK